MTAEPGFVVSSTHSSGDPDSRSLERRGIFSPLLWILRIALAIVFLLSSLLKALDLEAFAVQVSYYGIVREPLIVWTLALVMVGAEAALGTALLIGLWMRRVTLPAAAAMLGGFSALLAWAWAFRDIENCGCFGRFLPMTPGEAILKNVIMIGVAGVAWWLEGRSGARSSSGLSRGGFGQGHLPHPVLRPHYARAGLCGAIGLVAMGVAALQPLKGPASETAGSSSQVRGAPREGRFSGYTATWNGAEVNLGEGTYVVAMLSDSCNHCAEIVAELNRLSGGRQVPQVIGLILGEPETLRQFRSQFRPQFATTLIPVLEFFNLIGDAPPRFYIVRDGRAVHHWDDEHLPTEALIGKCAEISGQDG